MTDIDTALVVAYTVYGLLAFGLVSWLARTLFAHGTSFLGDVFGDRKEVAESLNRLLVTGFYMGNLGFALLLFTTGSPDSVADVVANLITRLGILLLLLATIHFLNMWVFWKIRKKDTTARRPPVVPPVFYGNQPPPPVTRQA